MRTHRREGVTEPGRDGPVSHTEIFFQFQDLNKKEKLNNDFLIILKIFPHLFSLQGI
jgi:hypothetical protein